LRTAFRRSSNSPRYFAPTALIDSATDVDALPLRYPAVLKPRAREGGEGVVRVHSSQELRTGVAASPYPLLVQEMIDGDDIDFSFLADHGRLLAWTIHFTPTAGVLHFVADPEVLQVGRTVVERLVLHGTGNFDLMRDRRDGSVRLIECNPVFWETVAASAYAGVNLPALGVQRALGVETGCPTQTDLTYLTPRRLAAEILRRRRFAAISRASWRGALAVASDPLPPLAEVIRTKLHRA
jgi:predicted ATP-grasp superfamily ATP-dependent carboligase